MCWLWVVSVVIDPGWFKLLFICWFLYGPYISFTLFLHQGVAIIHLRKMWEKLLLAARVIAAIENPADICVLSHRPYGQVSIGNV